MKFSLTDEELENINKIQEDVEEKSKVIDAIVVEIISPYCKDLDTYVSFIKDCLKAFQHLLYKNIKYNNDRIIKLLSKLELIYNENKNSKIIIFVPFEKLALLLKGLEDYFSMYNLLSDDVIIEKILNM